MSSLILDITMGEVSGIDIASTLRDSGCRARVVFLTVHAEGKAMKEVGGILNMTARTASDPPTLSQ